MSYPKWLREAAARGGKRRPLSETPSGASAGVDLPALKIRSKKQQVPKK